MLQDKPAPSLLDSGSTERPTNFRWVICGLLLYATTINYIDRSILNAMAPTLKGIIGWTDYQFGLINAAFTLAYAIGFLIMGRLIDAIGTRLGYAVALIFWSLSGLATALTSTPLQFGAARFFLGIGEAGNFPAAIKTVSEWFPQKQRATATGIFNAGSNVGAILAPILALSIIPFLGWRAAFFVTPILAGIWVVLWLTWYRNPNQHPSVNQAERDLIASDAPPAAPSAPVRWRHILPHRQAWAFMMGKFLTDPIWWFYLFWSGQFFAKTFKVDLKGLALPLIYIYIIADVGSIAGGYLSSSLIKRGWSVNAARKTAMGLCATLILPVIFAPMIPTNWPGAMWIAATLIGIAAGAHQGFSANIFTTASDMFPKRSISSVVGLGGLAGAVGGMIVQALAGVVMELTGSFLTMFIIAGTIYVFAVIVVHLLAPRLERIPDDKLESKNMPLLVSLIMWLFPGFVVGLPLSFLFQSQACSLTVLPPVKEAAATMAATLPAPVPGFSFAQYMAAILNGDIFRCVDHSQILPTIGYTPLITAGAMALVGMALHPLLFPRRKMAA